MASVNDILAEIQSITTRLDKLSRESPTKPLIRVEHFQATAWLYVREGSNGIGVLDSVQTLGENPAHCLHNLYAIVTDSTVMWEAMQNGSELFVIMRKVES